MNALCGPGKSAYSTTVNMAPKIIDGGWPGILHISRMGWPPSGSEAFA